MTEIRATLLANVQQKLRTLLQPLYDEQMALRNEACRFAEDAGSQAAVLERMAHDLAASVLFSRWLQFPDTLASRKEAGHWLNWLGLTGEGVEVGVLKGEYSDALLATWACSRLTSIDPWRSFPATEYVDTYNVSDAEHEANFRDTSERLSRFGDRSRIIRATSAEGVAQCADHSLDFVYLDAQHHYEAVRDDIALWHPKVRPGGVIGGHDFLDGQMPSGLYGVKQAVNEFCAANGCELVVTREPAWPSWFAKVG